MAKSNSRRRSKKALQRGVAYVVSVAEAGDVDLTLFVGRRAVKRTLKAGEAQLLAHLLTQTWQQSLDHQSTGWCAPSSHQPLSICGCDTNA